MLAAMARKQPADKPPHPLRQWRDQHDLSQDELAERCGVGQGMISHIERYFRVPRKSTLIKLQDFTGLPTDALMFPERFLEQNPEYFRPKKGRRTRREGTARPGGEEGRGNDTAG